jgi:flagellar hook-length control protein FliK
LPSAADVLAAMQTTARSNATVAAAAGTVLDAPTPEKPVIVAPETARPQANSTPVVVAASAAEGKPMDRLFVETWDEHEQAQQAWMSRPVAYAEALRSYRQIAADQPQATREPAETAAPEKAAPRASEAKAERVEAAKLHKATSTVDEADHAAPTAAKAPASSEAPAAPVDAVGQATASVEVKANPIVAPAPAAINHGAKTTAPTASPVNLDVEIARIERLVEATGRALLAKAAEGGGSMRLRLEPPELGHVRLDIQVSKDIVRAEAVVEHSQVKQALLDQMPQLRQTLADRGLDLQGFDVRQQLFDWSGQQNANGDRSFTWRDDGQRWPVEEARQSVAAASRSGGRRNFGGSISIMV